MKTVYAIKMTKWSDKFMLEVLLAISLFFYEIVECIMDKLKRGISGNVATD